MLRFSENKQISWKSLSRLEWSHLRRMLRKHPCWPSHHECTETQNKKLVDNIMHKHFHHRMMLFWFRGVCGVMVSDDQNAFQEFDGGFDFAPTAAIFEKISKKVFFSKALVTLANCQKISVSRDESIFSEFTSLTHNDRDSSLCRTPIPATFLVDFGYSIKFWRAWKIIVCNVSWSNYPIFHLFVQRVFRKLTQIKSGPLFFIFQLFTLSVSYFQMLPSSVFLLLVFVNANAWPQFDFINQMGLGGGFNNGPGSPQVKMKHVYVP